MEFRVGVVLSPLFGPLAEMLVGAAVGLLISRRVSWCWGRRSSALLLVFSLAAVAAVVPYCLGAFYELGVTSSTLDLAKSGSRIILAGVLAVAWFATGRSPWGRWIVPVLLGISLWPSLKWVFAYTIWELNGFGP